MNIVVIGLGGIGSHLVRPLCRYLSERSEPSTLRLVDGDHFEQKNAGRQEFGEIGNKAEVLARELATTFPRLDIASKPWYVTKENAYVTIYDRDVVFLCVDNHASRKVVSDHCGELQNVVLISGGNEFSDGNVQVFIRSNGENVTPPLTHLHPEIEEPEDTNHGEMSCEELAREGSPQLIFTNVLAAGWMLASFWKFTEWLENPEWPFTYSELFFDATTGNTRAVYRNKESFVPTHT